MKVLSPAEIQKRLSELPYGGMTKVAEALGMTKQAVSEMKVNPDINPTWSTLVKFSEYLCAGDNEDWVEWNGGKEPPEIKGLRCDIKLRNGNVYKHENSYDWWDNWKHKNLDADIIAYRESTND